MSFFRNTAALRRTIGAIIILGIILPLRLDATDNLPTQPWSLDKSPASGQLKAFIAAKEAQANTLAAAEGKELAPELKSLFAAAAQSDLRTMSNIWEAVRDHSTKYAYPDIDNQTPSRGPQWQPALETYGALAAFNEGGDKFAIAFARGVILSISPGSIYFGGTSAGRFLVTALSRSQINADPFFTLTQNGLQDNAYLDYLRSMYGSKINIPNTGEVQRCFREYAAELQHHAARGEKLGPDDSVSETNGGLRVTGAGAIFEIRDRIARLIFDKNPDREFYIEESFVMPWTYPYLEPHGLILKLNRTPLLQLDPLVIARDHKFWNDLIGQLFINAEFLHNRWARLAFSKLRTASAGLYAYRHLNDEAIFAFKQAVAICPENPEANFRFVQFYVELGRIDDGLTVLKALQQRGPTDPKLQGAINQLENLKSSKPATSSP